MAELFPPGAVLSAQRSRQAWEVRAFSLVGIRPLLWPNSHVTVAVRSVSYNVSRWPRPKFQNQPRAWKPELTKPIHVVLAGKVPKEDGCCSCITFSKRAGK